MAMTSQRPFAGPPAPASPALTTASSLNYSAYGSTSYGTPGRNATPSVASSGGYGPSRMASGAGVRKTSGNLKPPMGIVEKKVESRDVARVHYNALKDFLSSWLAKESPTSRASAREKLTRLTKLQFQELSTDVYDELIRRLGAETGSPDGDLPFLPVRDDFHPKRNQARQKLATLPKNRFKDLASDVYYELRRRYPEFEEAEVPSDEYDEPPPAPGPTALRPAFNQKPSSSSLSSRDNPTPPPGYRSGSASNLAQQRSRNPSGSSLASLAQGRPSLSSLHEKQGSYSSNSGAPPTLSAATSDVVVPTLSRMREEDIEVPYARESQLIDGPSMRRSSSRAESRSSAGRESRASFGGNSMTSDRERNRNRDRERDRERDPDPQEMLSPVLTEDKEYYDRMSFSSNVTRSGPGGNGNGAGWDEEREQKIRAEYEFRVAGLERRAMVAEAERDEAKRAVDDERGRRIDWEEEVRGLKERSGNHASSLRSLQHELDIARDAADAARRHAEQTSQALQDEMSQWRDRCDGLEDELKRLEDEKAARDQDQRSGSNDQVAAQLKEEMHSLLDELNALSIRNDELMNEREQDAQGMNDMEAKVEEYKRKWEAARIELRNLKATSTMFVSKPLSDDHLPASPDGNIADVNVSAFQAAIDGILAAARSSTPTGVLPAMKAVVESVTYIGEDVKTFEAKPNLDVDVSRLESLKFESTSRLNNLMQAARNHAMASGLSPVSLLDGAAGHLSANVVEIIKLLKIRRSGKPAGNGVAMGRRGSSMSIRDMVNRSTSGDQSRSVSSANGTFDREYGTEERLNSPASMSRSMSNDKGRSGTPSDLAPSPISRMANGWERNGENQNQNLKQNQNLPNIRINSFQSASSNGNKSDSFELEHNPSQTSDRGNPVRPVIDTQFRNGNTIGANGNAATNAVFDNNRRPSGPISQSSYERARSDRTSVTSASSPRGLGAPYETPLTTGYSSYPKEQDEDEGRNDAEEEKEWDDLKPYLETQSSALVNSIQNLLAAIRTGTQSPALNEHLSEVIAIGSSIVAVSTNSLPRVLRGEGDVLLKDLVLNTNKLSEAQEMAKKQGGGFEKGVRQQIASASFGVAKSLKALMKLGTV